MPYEYVDPDYTGIRKALEELNALPDEETEKDGE